MQLIKKKRINKEQVLCKANKNGGHWNNNTEREEEHAQLCSDYGSLVKGDQG